MARWNLALLAALSLGATAAAQHRAEQRDMALVGYSDLQAQAPTSRRSTGKDAMDRLHRPPRWPSAQSHHRHGRTQRHVGRRRHGSEEAALPRAHPRGGGPGEAEGAQMVESGGSTLPRADKQGLPAALVRQFGSRDLGRHGSGQAVAAARAGGGPPETRTRASGNATRASLYPSSPARRSGAREG